jgi:hypothetical protein
MEGCTSVQNCQEDSVNVDGGLEENKTASWFSKLKLIWKHYAPDVEQPTWLRSAVEATRNWGKRTTSDMGRTCSKRLRSLKIPAFLKSRLKEADNRNRRTIKRIGRIGRFFSNQVRSIKIPLSWKSGIKTEPTEIWMKSQRKCFPLSRPANTMKTIAGAKRFSILNMMEAALHPEGNIWQRVVAIQGNALCSLQRSMDVWTANGSHLEGSRLRVASSIPDRWSPLATWFVQDCTIVRSTEITSNPTILRGPPETQPGNLATISEGSTVPAGYCVVIEFTRSRGTGGSGVFFEVRPDTI